MLCSGPGSKISSTTRRGLHVFQGAFATPRASFVDLERAPDLCDGAEIEVRLYADPYDATRMTTGRLPTTTAEFPADEGELRQRSRPDRDVSRRDAFGFRRPVRRLLSPRRRRRLSRCRAGTSPGVGGRESVAAEA